VNQLIDDIIENKTKTAYRIGTLVIHKDENVDNKVVFNIVDGQQRCLTLSLIAHAILKNKNDILQNIKKKENFTNYSPRLLNLKFSNDITKYNIQNNYKEIERRVREFDENVIEFFFNKCELVQVVLFEISEAFQFFDSQNTRGKDLEPHDLLKAFHLREMAHLSTEEKLKSVATWESTETKELAELFAIYLFRIKNWSKGYSARYFTKDDVDMFKGISIEEPMSYPFIKLFQIGHFYTENYNKDGNRKIDGQQFDFPFQLDQLILNGKRFFEMIEHYRIMVEKIINTQSNTIDHDLLSDSDINNYKIQRIFKTLSEYEGRNRIGDKYIRMLFDCCLIYYLDKFGIQNISNAIEKFFIWSYTLRLQMQAVQIASVDNYAVGNENLFKIILEAIHHKEIGNIKLEQIHENRSTKTDNILDLFKELFYYEQ
jgi:hypothetical protein